MKTKLSDSAVRIMKGALAGPVPRPSRAPGGWDLMLAKLCWLGFMELTVCEQGKFATLTPLGEKEAREPNFGRHNRVGRPPMRTGTYNDLSPENQALLIERWRRESVSGVSRPQTGADTPHPSPQNSASDKDKSGT